MPSKLIQLTCSDSASADEQQPSLDVEVLGEVPMDLLPNCLDSPAAMVPGHVGVQGEPRSRGAVLVRAVSWQEVRPQAGPNS